MKRNLCIIHQNRLDDNREIIRRELSLPDISVSDFDFQKDHQGLRFSYEDKNGSVHIFPNELFTDDEKEELLESGKFWELRPNIGVHIHNGVEYKNPRFYASEYNSRQEKAESTKAT